MVANVHPLACGCTTSARRPVLNPAPGVARQPRSILLHDVRTARKSGTAAMVSVTNSNSWHLPTDHVKRRFGLLTHIYDEIGRDEHVQQMRQASFLRDGRVTLQVKVNFAMWTPDAKICDEYLPNGDKDAWAALYTHLLGTPQQPATRASWNALGLTNVYAVFLPGPDAFTSKSWHAPATSANKRRPSRSRRRAARGAHLAS